MSKKRKRSTNRPLKGVRVLVGRARHQAGALSAELRNRGAQILEIPFIEIRKPRSFRPLDSALKNLNIYDWLILTSVNGVEAMWARIGKATRRSTTWHQSRCHAEGIHRRIRGPQFERESKREACPAGPRQGRTRRDPPRAAQGWGSRRCRRGLRNRSPGEFAATPAGRAKESEQATQCGDLHQFVDREELCGTAWPTSKTSAAQRSTNRLDWPSHVRHAPRTWASG